jgi:hypothetical protein
MLVGVIHVGVSNGREKREIKGGKIEREKQTNLWPRK